MAYGPKPKPRNLNPEDIAPWDCMRCGRTLRIEAYHPHSGAAYGYSKKCRECTNSEAREAAKRRGPEHARNAKLIKNYGITLVELERRLEAQGGCAVCKTSTPGTRYWHVDHDHACCPIAGKSCGKCIRGVLCHRCNVALGHFRDSAEILMSAVRYLEASRG